jgi:hypothetical protein
VESAELLLYLYRGLDVCVQGLCVLAYFVCNMHCHYSTMSVDLWDCSDLVKEKCLQ